MKEERTWGATLSLRGILLKGRKREKENSISKRLVDVRRSNEVPSDFLTLADLFDSMLTLVDSC